MTIPEHLEAIETYLRGAAVVYADEGGATGKSDSRYRRLILEGGVRVQVKPDDGSDPNAGNNLARGVLCEEGGWVVACLLGWTDLVAITVQRRLMIDGQERNTAVQVLWPQALPDEDAPALPEFPNEDRWRAAVFDAVIAHADREHNWTSAPDVHPRRLRLFDHAYAFDCPGMVFQSSFFDEPDKKDKELPHECFEALERFIRDAPKSRLANVLPQGAFDPMMVRAKHLVKVGKLELPPKAPKAP